VTAGLRELIEAWDGMAVVTQYDPETKSRIFIALHNDALGIPVGGTRMMVDPSHEDGLEDALRLAEGMTRNRALTDVSNNAPACPFLPMGMDTTEKGSSTRNTA
jgi:hypothetical protein